MNLVKIGQIYYPGDVARINTVGAVYTNNLSSLHLSGVIQKIACIFQIPSTAAGKSISSIRTRLGTVSSPQDMVCSINTLDATNTFPSTSFYGGSNSGFVLANNLVQNSGITFNLLNQAAVIPGDFVACVIGVAVSGGDIFIADNSTPIMNFPNYKNYNTASTTWSNISIDPLPLAISCTDGTYLNIGTFFTENVSQISFDSTSIYNENAISFSPPFNCRVIGAWFNATFNSNVACVVNLYDNTNIIGSSNTITHQVKNASNVSYIYFNSPVILNSGGNYFISLTPQSSAQINLWCYETISPSAFEAYDRLPGNSFAQRSGTPYAWDTSTYNYRIPSIGAIIDQIDVGSISSNSNNIINGSISNSSPSIRWSL